MTEELRLDWGHRVFDPDGQPIQLPSRAIRQLRRLGVLKKNRNLGGFQISETIYELLRSEYDPLTEGLRPLLGADLSGPSTVKCGCETCNQKASLILDEIEQLGLFRLDMARQQSVE